MKDILPYYEREQANIAVLVREFGEQYPQLASSLGFVEGKCEEPHVQRVVESMVMLGARILKQLEEGYPQFTEALLGMNYPHYTQPFPSTSIAHFASDSAAAKAISDVTVIPRGAIMHTKVKNGVQCHFRSAYDVTIAPVILSHVAFHPMFSAPPAVRAPFGTTSMLQITIEGSCASQALDQLDLRYLRVFIEGEPSLRAMLRDTLFMKVLAAYVQVDARFDWIALKEIPITTAGFCENEALIPSMANSHPAYRLLTEYFTFQEKFNFVDIDLAALARHLPSGGQRMTLHLALSGISADSDAARILNPVSSKNFLLSCTPVVNLFERAATPIDLTHTKVEYDLIPSVENPSAYDVYKVDTVRVVRNTTSGSKTTDFYPYYSLRHGLAGGRRGHYFSTRRDDVAAMTRPGHEIKLSLVDIDHRPLALESSAVSVMLTCTNRDLPNSLPIGSPSGDLSMERLANNVPIVLLRKPTPTHRFPTKAHWQLISQLTLNSASLVQENLEAFTEILALHNLPQTAANLRQIRGIVGLSKKNSRAWIADNDGRNGARVHGSEVSITLDESAFVGSSIHIFAQVVDRFLGLYTQVNTFTQLVILSKSTDMELIRCKPRSGNLNLV
jgi:type VI secretion system protein ImpG